jgi:NADH-quinone oxidoreductase subunit E
MPFDPQKVDAMLARYGGDKSALIQLLQDMQAEYRYLPREALEYLGEKLNVPLATIYHVATFYKAFSLQAKGRHCLSVCMGTACHVRGAPMILDTAARELDLAPDTTAKDGSFTLETVNCLGSCALGPLVVVDGEYHGHMNNAKIRKDVAAMKKQEGK